MAVLGCGSGRPRCGAAVARQRRPVVRGRDRDAATDRDRRPRSSTDSPSPTPSAAPADAGPARRARRRRRSSRSPTSGRPPTVDEREGARGGPGRHAATATTALELVEGEADAILARARRADRPSEPARLILAPDATTLAADLAKNRKRLAFLRADAVGPAVRALAWGDTALFGVDRVKTLADWPLTRAACPRPTAADAYDPATTWTLFAGGDILLDRGVYLTLKDKGADFPFDGGTADITGRCKDCSPLGWDTPYTKRTGNAGAVRDLIKGADIADRQLREPGPEQPALPRLGDHLLGRPAAHRRPRRTPASTGSRWPTTTSATPARPGCCRRSKNVKKRGIAVLGRRQGPRTAARKPAILEAGGTKVAILGYDAIAGGYHATADQGRQRAA